jgi:hypothetical protein
MGKPTFDLCYSEEGMRTTLTRGTPGLAGKRMAVRRMGDKSMGPEIFGLAEIMRRYLFLESIGE